MRTTRGADVRAIVTGKRTRQRAEESAAAHREAGRPAKRTQQRPHGPPRFDPGGAGEHRPQTTHTQPDRRHHYRPSLASSPRWRTTHTLSSRDRPRRDGRAAHVGESDRVVPTHTVPRLSPTGWSTRRSVWGARPGGRGNLRNRNRKPLRDPKPRLACIHAAGRGVLPSLVCRQHSFASARFLAAARCRRSSLSTLSNGC